MRFVLALAVVACGGGSGNKEPTLTREQQAQKCARLAEHLVRLMTDGETGSVPAADRLRRALTEHCTQELWSIDAQDCFSKLASIDNADTCAPLLTVPQRDGFQQAIEGALR